MENNPNSSKPTNNNEKTPFWETKAGEVVGLILVAGVIFLIKYYTHHTSTPTNTYPQASQYSQQQQQPYQTDQPNSQQTQSNYQPSQSTSGSTSSFGSSSSGYDAAAEQQKMDADMDSFHQQQADQLRQSANSDADMAKWYDEQGDTSKGTESAESSKDESDRADAISP